MVRHDVSYYEVGGRFGVMIASVMESPTTDMRMINHCG